MRTAALFAVTGFVAALVFVRRAAYDDAVREAADPTDQIDRAIRGLPPLPDPWYVQHPVELVLGVTVVALVVGLLVAIVARVER
jgi:hypothetical protein